ncbi:hypothetical protein BDZ91DRAFT_169246 [Kalaharituber pfeilii]|nr:hypothetical protein BDZ91DRAFT_169246 [Kalaharituber pfeilii]
MTHEILDLEVSSSERYSSNSSNPVRLCFISRPHVHDHVKCHQGNEVSTFTVVAQEDDIQKYLQHRIDERLARNDFECDDILHWRADIEKELSKEIEGNVCFAQPKHCMCDMSNFGD